MIKFQKYYVQSGTIKAKVYYSLHKMASSGEMCVTLYAKDYDDGHALKEIFGGEYENHTNMMADYFEKGLVRIKKGHPFYLAAKARANAITKERMAA